MNERIFLTVDQTAEMWQVHPNTVRNRIADGTLKAFRVGRAIRIRQVDAETFARPVTAAKRRRAS